MDRQRFHLSRQEELTAQTVFALLLSQGHDVIEVRRPPLGDGRSPDFVFQLDGRPVALEVVRYLERQEAQKALSRVFSVESALQERLAPDAAAAQGKIAINLRYSAPALRAHKRRDVGPDADRLAADVRAAIARATTSPVNMVDVPTGVPWIEDAQVTVLPGEEPGTYFAIPPGLPAGIPDPDEFIRRTIASKGSQHIGHGDKAILAVLGMFHDDAEDLALAFKRWTAPIPWWRVYFVRYSATLVYEQPTQTDS